MARAKELFEIDHPQTMTARKEVSVDNGQINKSIPIRLHYDIDVRVIYCSLYIENDLVPHINILLNSLAHQLETLLLPAGCHDFKLPSNRKMPKGFSIQVANYETLGIAVDPQDGENIDASKMPFSGTIFVYCDDALVINNELKNSLMNNNIHLRMRDKDYMKKIDMNPRAFISHDSRDKEDIAQPIANKLMQMQCPIWYDEYSLTVGDSLRDSIGKGLKESDFCIVLLAPNFLGKGGWPKREYDSAFTREIIEDRNVILPVWCNVGRDEVYEYSPILADRVGLNWSEGEDEVCRKLYLKIENDEIKS